jgi:hypothetical protein
MLCFSDCFIVETSLAVARSPTHVSHFTVQKSWAITPSMQHRVLLIHWKAAEMVCDAPCQKVLEQPGLEILIRCRCLVICALFLAPDCS